MQNHEWAGEYYYGDGLGVNVEVALAPVSGFVYAWNGCLGLYDINYGGVQFSDDTVKMLSKYPNTQEGFRGIATELLQVRWGKRHYLIPVDDMVHFTNEINAGTEPNTPFGAHSYYFLLKKGDEKKKVEGLPNIPQEYLVYILAKPVRAKISAIQATHEVKSTRITSITIDTGSADGLKPGMELYVRKPTRLYASALVTSVAEHSAQATIEQSDLADPAPSIGWILSTKL